MSENVKLDLRLSRKLLLLLNQALEIGLLQSGEAGGTLAFFPKEAIGELRALMGEGLEKAQLKELYEKLKGFQQAK